MSRLTSSARTIGVALLAMSAMSAAACAVPVAPAESKETDEHVASGAQAILNGSPVDPEKIGVVVVNTPGGGCSGALLNNQWVITAKHCTDGLTAPWQIQVLLGAHSSYGLKYYRHPDQFTDVAIIELEWPLAMQGKTTGYSRPLSTTPIDQFKDSPVFCYGYGLPNFPTLRGAIMAVGGAGTSSFQLLPWSSSNPSLLVEGDSGGICTGWDGSIVGIQSLVFQLSPTNEWDQQARADAVASWVSFKMNGGIIVCPPAICGG